MQKSDYLNLRDQWPQEPGVYRFIGIDDEILYIGKAKNLKKRLASYFGNQKNQRRKTKIMVRAALRLEYTLVDTEQDALLLEASLIRKHRPRYNVALKDSRPYPYLCIKAERFPRVLVSYGAAKDGSRYFGPYVSKKRVYQLMDLIRSVFKLRTCQLILSEEAIAAKKYNVCLEYHIKQCQAPCIGLENEADYQEKIEQIAAMLKGQYASVKRYLQAQMWAFAEDLAFERAEEVKQQLKALEDYQGKSTVVNPSLGDLDVIAITSEEQYVCASYLKIAEGAIIYTFLLEMQMGLQEDLKDLLPYVVLELRERFGSIAPEVIVPFETDWQPKDFRLSLPKIGDKRKLLDLAEKNLQYHLLQRRKKRLERSEQLGPRERLMEQMRIDLRLPSAPVHIECFDNSNLQGTNPVSAMVVFKQGKPSKREYRHYHIKTVVGPDDYASMREVVTRRYARLLAERLPLPQLILIDGGRGQVSAAYEALEALGLVGRVALVGIAKRLEELYFPDEAIPLLLSKKSPTLKVLQQARDEAHRFGLSFHRDLRSKALTQTLLLDLPGIGPKRAEDLLRHFGSVKAIGQASEEALAAIVGPKLAKLLRSQLGGSLTQEEDTIVQD